MTRIRALEPARREDFEAAVLVWRASRMAAVPWLEARLPHSLEEDRQHFRDAILPSHRVWVAVRDGAIVGVLTLDGARLGHLYVAPSAQGSGVGTALLDHAKALSPSGLTLFTHVRNERARAFYERRGFRAVRFGTSPPPESEPDVEYAWTP